MSLWKKVTGKSWKHAAKFLKASINPLSGGMWGAAAMKIGEEAGVKASGSAYDWSAKHGVEAAQYSLAAASLAAGAFTGGAFLGLYAASAQALAAASAVGAATAASNAALTAGDTVSQIQRAQKDAKAAADAAADAAGSGKTVVNAEQEATEDVAGNQNAKKKAAAMSGAADKGRAGTVAARLGSRGF